MINYSYVVMTGFFMNTVVAQQVRFCADRLLPDPYRPLPDIIHILFPPLPTVLPDVVLFFSGLDVALKYPDLENPDENILCLGLCLIIRAFSVCLTMMPTCMPRPRSSNNLYQEMFLSTHDLMFSGHTLFFIAYGNMLNHNHIKWVGPLLLVIARQHYTIDVCVAALVYSYVYMNIDTIQHLELFQ